MSRDRFSAIFSMLHVNDNNLCVARDQPNHDPLHKVRPLLDHDVEGLKKNYIPSENLTIDEGICSFRRRVSFRVYIKNKPNKYGIKLFEVCEANSGYTCNLEVYSGVSREANPDGPVVGVVTRLLEPYLNQGYTVYLDRYFTSVKLFDNLWQQDTLAVGTIMSNRRDLPQQAFAKKLKKGEQVFRRRDHLLSIKWKDVRDVFMVSTKHTAEMKEVQQRGNHQKIKPTAVVDYNKNKVGVDRSDQSLSYYSFRRYSVKWWKKLFMHLFDLSMVNAWIVYNKTRSGKKMSLVEYYMVITNGFVESAGVDMSDVVQSPQSGAGRVHGREHFPAQIPATEKGTEGKVQRRCVVCAERGKHSAKGKSVRKDTTVMCKKCQVPLCVLDCFKSYHTKTKYWEV